MTDFLPDPPPVLDDADAAAVAAQLDRPPRGLRSVAQRCACGLPDVVETAPRLPDGAPFPTLYYLTCPRAASAIGTLEASGLMAEMGEHLERDRDLRDAYRHAHVAYLAARDAIEPVPEISGTTAGGMPDRVKCLHALVAHSLAAGTGVNPLGDEALERLEPWWASGPCLDPPTEAAPA
jgi:hypothetical protein